MLLSSHLFFKIIFNPKLPPDDGPELIPVSKAPLKPLNTEQNMCYQYVVYYLELQCLCLLIRMNLFHNFVSTFIRGNLSPPQLHQEIIHVAENGASWWQQLFPCFISTNLRCLNFTNTPVKTSLPSYSEISLLMA